MEVRMVQYKNTEEDFPTEDVQVPNPSLVSINMMYDEITGTLLIL